MTKTQAQKKCFECHSVCNLEAPYCDACGYRFRAVAVPAPPSWKYRLGAIAAGLAVAVIYQLIRG